MKKLFLPVLAFLLVFLWGYGISYANINDGVVAYWSFDNCNAHDDSENGHEGNPYGNPQCVDGKKGKAFNFDGNSYIEVPHDNALNPTDAITISLWAKEDSASPAYSSLIYKAGGEPIGWCGDRVYSLWTRNDKGIHFNSTPEGSTNQMICDTASNSYQLGEFVHIVGVIDTVNSNSMTTYINGQKVSTCAYGNKIRSGTYPLRIGGHFHYGGDQFNFNGTIDEVRIYNRALSESEIQDLYTGTIPSVSPLHNENGLIMTTSDYSNFATRVYFNALRINHSGVDLALSQDGSRTASTVTASKPVYAICDGEVDFIYSRGGINSFVKIHHPDCNGQDIIAYYGHITPKAGLTTVTKDDPIGTIKDQRGNSHLHLTIDTQTARNLSSINNIVCNYELDTAQTVISLSNCSNGGVRNLANNQMLLRVGWGQVSTLLYKDSKGRIRSNNLYISEDAMRDLGFIPFFDLY